LICSADFASQLAFWAEQTFCRTVRWVPLNITHQLYKMSISLTKCTKILIFINKSTKILICHTKYTNILKSLSKCINMLLSLTKCLKIMLFLTDRCIPHQMYKNVDISQTCTKMVTSKTEKYKSVPVPHQEHKHVDIFHQMQKMSIIFTKY
jgi:hypothetical protein